MKYLLFLKHSSGEMENALYTSLKSLCERLESFLDEEELYEDIIPNHDFIKYELESNDEYYSELSKGVWYHIQKEYKFYR